MSKPCKASSSILLTVILGFLTLTTVHSQAVRVTLDPPDNSGFVEYVAYYMTGFDVQSGTSNFQFFRYKLVANTYPADVKLIFSLTVRSPGLDLNLPTEIIRLETNRFTMPSHPITIDNRDLSRNTAFFYDQASPPNAIPVSVSTLLDVSQFDALISSIITSGKIIDGEYVFNIQLKSGRPGGALSSEYEVTKSITVRTPTAIQLQSPGGELADTSQNVIYTTFPLFLWDTDLCAACEYYIRVAEFNPSLHSSPSEAIEDETMLPIRQNQQWATIPAGASYQYSPTGTRPLESGKIYVWQIRKTFPTSAGNEEILSPIYAYKIGDMGTPVGLEAAFHPILQALMDSLEPDDYELFFGDNGILKDAEVAGQYQLNGNTIDESSTRYILSQIANGNVTVTGARVE